MEELSDEVASGKAGIASLALAKLHRGVNSLECFKALRVQMMAFLGTSIRIMANL